MIGTRRWLGVEWVHVDADASPLVSPQGRLHAVDVVSDARHIDLPDGCAEEVYSQECLEHFSWHESAAVVAEWARLVGPGGQLRIEVPDFLAACQQVLEVNSEHMDGAIQQIIFGGQANQWDYHYCGVTPRLLCRWMTDAGLTPRVTGRGWEVGYLQVVGRR